MAPPLQIDNHLLKKAALSYRAINHRLRVRILFLLHDHGRLTVTTVYKVLKVEQSVASQHLGILRKADLVTTEREGKWIFYSVNYQRLRRLHTAAEMLFEKRLKKSTKI